MFPISAALHGQVLWEYLQYLHPVVELETPSYIWRQLDSSALLWGNNILLISCLLKSEQGFINVS